jgi:Ca-activated chloride channel homolog
MTFLSPLWLLFLVPVAVLAVAYVVMQRRRQRYVVRFSTLPMLQRIAPRTPRWRRHLPASLVLVALTGLGVAAARPELTTREPYDRATVVLAVDVSRSMAATDVAPNRLEAARDAATRFIAELPPTIDVGVVAFAGTAQVLATPTTDHAEVAASLSGLQLGNATAIGEGVVTSLAQVRQLAADTPGGEDVPARIVLLSDGQNTSGTTIEDAAAQAQAAGVPVSTIAYGTADGRIGGNAGGQSVPADDAALATLADTTGGQAYAATDADQLRSVYDDIGSIVGYRDVTREITAWFAAAGLVLALVAGALSLRWFARLV